MNLHEALEIRPGVTSVIGSGGKSTLLARLAAELAEGGATVALATTTHFMPFPGVACVAGGSAEEVRLALAAHGVTCVACVACVAAPAGGAAGAAGKLGPAALAPAELVRLADYVLVEADGSKRLPLKAHAAWEPVVPEGSTQSVLVVGASGFGRPVREAVHRPERFCELAGCSPEDEATPEAVAAVIRAEGLAGRVVVNQCEGEGALACARRLEALLDVPVAAGSLREGRLERLG